MSEWQPIETAPKDGTPVLVAQPRDKHGWWIDVAENFYEVDEHLDATDKWLGRESHSVSCRPTHWMPLPEPPK